MSTVFLRLGTVTFANFEIPEKINFGGSQALSVKQLVGGKRIVDAMGRVDDDITWSGIMFESTATQRAQFLDAMRVAGAPLTLTWGQFNYLVVIKSFRASFERTYQIPYEITCVVIQDLNKPFPFLVPVLYNDAILNLLTEAQDLAGVIANPSVSNAMTLVTAAIQEVPNFNTASSAQVASVLVALGPAISTVNSVIATTNSSIFPAITASPTNSLLANSPTQFPTVTADVLSADFLQLGNLYLLQSILGNMEVNLSLISEGATGQTITVTNTSLFQLAAKYYGDANQWVTIAEANGLTDPYVQGGSIASVNVINGGSNYVSPEIIVTGNEVNPASFVLILQSGVITGVQVPIGGLYTTDVTFSVIDTGGIGTGAEFTVNMAQTLIIPQSSNSLTGGVLVD